MFANVEEWIVRLPVLLFAITIHEYSHGKAAYSLGDPTAKMAGRLTWNPLRHIDLLGALCLFLSNFGWAKPVPVNTSYFRNPRRDVILLSLSGPLSNFAAAFLSGLFMRYFLFPWPIYQAFLVYMMLMNLGLALFNLIPIPPLDGSHVLENLLRPSAAATYRRLGRYGFLFIAAIILLDNFAHTRIIARILGYPMAQIALLLGGENFFRLLAIS